MMKYLTIRFLAPIKLLGVLTFSLFLAGCGQISGKIEELTSGTGLFNSQKINLISVGGTISINEGSAFALSLSFSQALPSSESVNYTITSTRGDQNADFVAAQGILIIPQGQQTANLIIQSTNDSIYEGNENFTLTFSTSSSVLDVTTNGTIGLTVVDDDPAPVVEFTSAAAVNVNEGAGTVTLPVSLDRASSQAITVAYSTTFNTASSADIGTSSGTLTFAAGQTSQNITISVVDDATVESGEDFDVVLGSITGTATLGATTTNNVTIIDNDYPSLSINDVSVGEASTATFTISLSTTSASNVDVNWATSNGTALAGTNYTSASGTATIIAGQTSVTVTVNTLANANICAANKTFNVTLSGAVNATIGDNLGVGSIVDADVPSISIADNSITEAGTGTITATLSQACATKNISFDWQTAVGGTATATTDYAAVSASTLTILAGSTTASLNVVTVSDTMDENDETVNVSISNPVNVTLGTSTAVLTILDDDAAPTLSINDMTVNEGAGTVTLTVTQSAVSGKNVSFTYDTADSTAVAPGDYTAVVAGAGTINAGSTTASIVVPIINDALSEATETFDVNLSAPVNATVLDGTGVVSITDNDTAPTIAINSQTVTEGTGGGPTVMTFTVTLSAAAGQNVTVNYASASGTATSGTDFTAVSGTLTFTPGQTTKTINVDVLHDALNEANETFTVTLSGGSNYTSSGSTLVGTGTITDDDAAPTVQFTAASSSTYENGSAITVTAQLSAVSGQAVSIPFTLTGTATLVTDYSITSSPITIAAGSTTATITVTPVDDAIVESDETVIITMGSPTNASAAGTTVHTATIQNDDLGSFSITGIQSSGGLDTTSDAYLNYEATPRILYGTSSGATSYDVTIYQNDGTTVECATQNTALTTYDPTACSLTAGNTYKLMVTAKVGSMTVNASNALYTFTYNRAPVIPNRGVWNVQMAGSRTQNVISDDPATVANDPATDADGDTLSISSVGSATYGTTSYSGQSITYTAAATYDGADSFTVTITDGKGAYTTATVSVEAISQYRWTGASGVDTNWSTTNNWCGTLNGSYNCSGGAAPGSSNVAVFDSSCTNCNATITSNVNVLGINMKSTYTGTITQNTGNTITVGTSSWKIYGGIFTGTSGTGDITVRGDFDLAAGATFTSTATNLYLAKVVTGCPSQTYSNYNFLGTFNHNNGTVNFNGTNNGTGSCQNAMVIGKIDIVAGITFYNMTVDANNLASSSYIPSIQMIQDTDILTVLNNFTFTSGYMDGGVINVEGNLYASSSAQNRRAGGGYTNLTLTGGTSTTYTVSNNTYGTPVLPDVILNKNSNAITFSSTDNRSIQAESLTLTSGEFVAPSGTLTLGVGEATASFYPTVFHAAGGLFTHSSGTVHFYGLTNYNSTNTLASYGTTMTINSTGISFNNVEITSYGTASTKTGGVNLYSSDITILGNLTIHSGMLYDGTLRLYGNLSVECASSSNCSSRYRGTGANVSAYIIFSGSAAQTYTFATNAATARMNINKTNSTDTVSPTAGSDLSVTAIDVIKGTLNLSANTTSIGWNYSSTTTSLGYGLALSGASSDIVVNHNSGTLKFDSTCTNTGNYVRTMSRLDLGGNALTLNNLSIDLNCGGIAHARIGTATDVITVNGDFTVNGGALMQAGASNPTTNQLIVYGNVAFNCPSSSECSSITTTGASYGIRAQLVGGNKTITQASGAAFGFKEMEVNLSSNANTLTLQSNLNSLLNVTGSAWTSVDHMMGIITKNGYTYTGINALAVTAGATCSGSLGYVSITGAGGCQ